MASSKPKIFISLIFVILCAVLAYYLLFDRFLLITGALDPRSDRYKIEELAEKRKIQYRLAYKGTGNLKQTIHLNTGPAVFVIFHEGSSDFTVELRTNRDSLITVLAKETGDWEGVSQVNIPEQDAYLLNVITTGKWGIAYK
ncbi:MAG: hypothetical protein HY959_08420 [Ignavibacteriae bacterium]|nr:hypothetical protein [Ignavibacteriota bacterium]